MPRGKPEIKAQAQAELATGGSSRQVAASVGVRRTTVQRWRDGTPAPSLSPQKKTELGGLVAEYMREALITLIEHQRLARDPTWFHKQNANDLGIFHGIAFDKLDRLVQRLGGSPGVDAGGQSPGSAGTPA